MWSVKEFYALITSSGRERGAGLKEIKFSEKHLRSDRKDFRES